MKNTFLTIILSIGFLISYAQSGDLFYYAFEDKIELNLVNAGNQIYETNGGATIQVTNSIILQWKEEATKKQQDKLIAKFNLVETKATQLYNLYQVNNPISVSQKIYETGLVRYCHPEFLIEAVTFEYIPNDEYFGEQFYLHNTGQECNDGNFGTVDADIDAPEAWEITQGSADVVIAILDPGGVTDDHPDLPAARQMRLAGSNFNSNDGLGDDDPSPTGNFHGNACAGIAAAEMDNEEGVAGVASGCTIMPVKIPGNSSAPGQIFADAITFAADNGANVISCSWGFPNSSQSPNHLPEVVVAIEYAITKGTMVLFAAGNTANHANGSGGGVLFPGNADIPQMITVGASDRNDEQANYSPTDTEIEISAPSSTANSSDIPGEGANVWTMDIPGDSGRNPQGGETLPNYGTNNLSYTGRMSGTSAATPEVAGVIALMLSINPCLTVDEILDILYDTAEKVGGYNYDWNNEQPGHSQELGFGRVNAFLAVQAAQGVPPPTPDSDFTFETDCVDGTLTITASSDEEDVSHFWGLFQTTVPNSTLTSETIDGNPDTDLIDPIVPVQWNTTATFTDIDFNGYYYIKHGIWKDGCFTWMETRIAIPSGGVSEFHFENENGTDYESGSTICYGQDIYINGQASENENRYFISIKRRAIGSTEPLVLFAELGWTLDATVGVINLSEEVNNLNQDLYFEPGYEYIVLLAIANLDECIGWTPESHSIVVECCPYTLAAWSGFINNTGLITASPDLDYSNIPPVQQQWFLLSSTNEDGGNFLFVDFQLGNSFSYQTTDDELYYFLFHKVFSECEESCIGELVEGGEIIQDDIFYNCDLLNCFIQNESNNLINASLVDNGEYVNTLQESTSCGQEVTFTYHLIPVIGVSIPDVILLEAEIPEGYILIEGNGTTSFGAGNLLTLNGLAENGLEVTLTVEATDLLPVGTLSDIHINISEESTTGFICEIPIASIQTTEVCKGDYNGDGVRTSTDLSAFLNEYGLPSGPCGIGDFNDDGMITASDLTSFLAVFGLPCDNNTNGMVVQQREFTIAGKGLEHKLSETDYNTLQLILKTNQEDLFAIYPNPTKGTLLIDTPVLDSECHVRITDVTGRIVLEKILVEETSGAKLDLSAVASGVYFITIHSENGVILKNSRIVKSSN